MKTNILWKIYFWFLVMVVGAFFGASLVQGLDAVKIIDFVISLISLAGLFGFAYRRKIGVSLLWKVWLPVIVAWDAWTNFLWNGLSGFHGLAWLDVIVVGAVFDAIFAGEYIALYLYGFRSEEIWRKANSA